MLSPLRPPSEKGAAAGSAARRDHGGGGTGALPYRQPCGRGGASALTTWRGVPARYGSRQSIYTRFRRWALDGTFERMLAGSRPVALSRPASCSSPG
ncbi:hypothetical protein C8054_16265 [Micromonospora sp. RP3T]|nr:hypothetical protein C8054_16265 [Micromonospora sp. RP3T]